MLRIATFNVNGIRSRLGHLLQWLEREQPDVACLQELKAPDEAFPVEAIHGAGYGAVWHGQRSWNGVAILARGEQPRESRRGLPGDPDDSHSRYIEATAHGVLVGCLYLPNGNPQPGPKFDYKLAWFERLIAHAAGLQAGSVPVVLAGDYNVVPTDFDIYNPASWRKDALLQPESRDAYARLLDQGWLDALRALHPGQRIYTFWDYFRQHWERNSGLRIDHLLLNPALAPRLRAGGVDTWVRGLPGASDHAPTWIALEAPKPRRTAKAPPGKRAVARKTAVKKPAAKKAPAGARAPAHATPRAIGAAPVRKGTTRSARIAGPVPAKKAPSKSIPAKKAPVKRGSPRAPRRPTT